MKPLQGLIFRLLTLSLLVAAVSDGVQARTLSGHYTDESGLTVAVTQYGDTLSGYVSPHPGLYSGWEGTITATSTSERFHSVVFQGSSHDREATLHGEITLGVQDTSALLTLQLHTAEWMEIRRLTRLPPPSGPESGLLRLLGMVPDLHDVARYALLRIGFTDHRALLEAEHGPGFRTQSEYEGAEYERLRYHADEWLHSNQRGLHGPGMPGAEQAVLAANMARATGLSWFEVNATLRLELMRGRAWLLDIPSGGAAQAQRMNSALMAHGYRRSDPAGAIGWQHETDSGDPADPFLTNDTAHLVLTRDGLLAASDAYLLGDLLWAQRGEAATLATAPDFLAIETALRAIGDDALLVQAQFYRADLFHDSGLDPLALLAFPDRDVRPGLLPYHGLVALADMTLPMDDWQLAVLALLYATRADAEQAAPVLDRRLRQWSLKRLARWQPQYRAPEFHTLDNGWTVLRLSVAYPRQSDGQGGQVMRVWAQALQEGHFDAILELRY